jgi:hypothetical protein
MSTDSADDDPTSAFVHWCEACGREELLSPDDAFKAGWDFPPNMGAWGVVSPRTCPNCAMKRTVWWAIAIEKLSFLELTPHQLIVIGRILNEVDPGAGSEPLIAPGA